MRPRKISRKNGALEREIANVDNFFMKFCSKGKHRNEMVAGGKCGVKADFLVLFHFVLRLGWELLQPA